MPLVIGACGMHAMTVGFGMELGRINCMHSRRIGRRMVAAKVRMQCADRTLLLSVENDSAPRNQPPIGEMRAGDTAGNST